MYIEWLTREIWNALIVGTIIIGLALAAVRIYADFTRRDEALTPGPSPSGRREQDGHVVGTPIMASAPSDPHAANVSRTSESKQREENASQGPTDD